MALIKNSRGGEYVSAFDSLIYYLWPICLGSLENKMKTIVDALDKISFLKVFVAEPEKLPYKIQCEDLTKFDFENKLELDFEPKSGTIFTNYKREDCLLEKIQINKNCWSYYSLPNTHKHLHWINKEILKCDIKQLGDRICKMATLECYVAFFNQP